MWTSRLRLTSGVELGTSEGWKATGRGLVESGQLLNTTSVESMMLRAQLGSTVAGIPGMSAYELGYGVGYGAEKLGEAALTRRALPMAKSSLGLPKGLGSPSKYTNWYSYKLKGKLGKLPIRVYTPLLGTAKTSDLGLVVSRNVLTPIGYTLGFGQLQYFPRLNSN